MTPLLEVDLGGTRTRDALADPNGRILLRRIGPTPQDAACHGRVDYGSGTLEHAPHPPHGWTSSLTEGKLSAVLGVHEWLANDPDLPAVGESRFGAGRGYDDLVYITISTAIGAAWSDAFVREVASHA